MIRRTDKGVSASCQVVGLHVRSNLKHGIEFIPSTFHNEVDCESPAELDNKDIKKEVEYDYLLNQKLPHTIRVLAWSPVALGFNARYDCNYRTYRYQ